MAEDNFISVEPLVVLDLVDLRAAYEGLSHLLQVAQPAQVDQRQVLVLLNALNERLSMLVGELESDLLAHRSLVDLGCVLSWSWTHPMGPGGRET